MNKLSIFLLIFFVYLAIGQISMSESIAGEPINTSKNYKYSYESYKKVVDIENENFSKSNFTLVENSEGLKIGHFLLRDNFGGLWLFKRSDSERILNGVIGYRLFKLFGCETPEAHTTLLIRGESIYGYIQRFIPDVEMLKLEDIDLLSVEQIEYLILQEILDWLFVSNDTDFLINYDNSGKVAKLIAVDKDQTLGSELFSFTHFYSYMWDKYVKGELDIDLEMCFNKAKFVADFPDDILIEVLRPYVDQFFLLGPVYRDKDGQLVLLENEEEFFKWLIQRK